MRIDWNKIPPQWEFLFYLFPYLLFSMSPVITILFYKPYANLDWFSNIYYQWIEAWPKLNTQFILVILALTLVLLILKAHKTKWIWGWLGFGFLGLGVFTPLLRVDLWRRHPGYVIEVMIWVIVIVTLLLVAMKAYRHKWFWAWLIISPLILLLPDVGKWLEEIGKFSFFEKNIRFIADDFLSGLGPYPFWLHVAQLTVFALAVILLIRVVHFQGENVFLFCFGALYGYWLFLIPSMLGRGYSTTDTTFLEPMKDFPFLYQAIGVASTLIPFLAMTCLFIFLVQKKWPWCLILFAGLVLLQFALLYWPWLAIFLKSPRTPDTELLFPPLLGSVFLGFLWLTIRLYFEIFIARPMTFLTLLLLLLFACLYLRKVLIERGSSGEIGVGA